MSCQKRITIIERTQVTGSLGTVKWFVPFIEWCFEDTSMILLDCEPCSEHTRLVKHYRVVIDGEDYYVPENAAAMTVYPQSEEHQDVHKLIEKLTEQPADWNETYEEITGVRIYNGRVDNGYDYANKIDGTSKQVGSDSKQ